MSVNDPTLRVDHPSTAAVAGHPIHPAIVPLPIGMLTAAAASDLAHLATGERFFARASRWLLGAGVLSGAAAASVGLVDFLTVRAARSGVGYAHGGGNAAVMLLAGTSLLLRGRSRDGVPAAAMALSLGAAGLLAVTGWLGGELAFRHRVGVIPLEER